MNSICTANNGQLNKKNTLLFFDIRSAFFIMSVNGKKEKFNNSYVKVNPKVPLTIGEENDNCLYLLHYRNTKF